MNRPPAPRFPDGRSRRKKEPQLLQATMQANAFNEKHPIGTPVVYRPVFGQHSVAEAETRSLAWVLPSGVAVVQITGKAGCVSLQHVKPVDA